jgi:hypothetical protein
MSTVCDMYECMLIDTHLHSYLYLYFPTVSCKAKTFNRFLERKKTVRKAHSFSACQIGLSVECYLYSYINNFEMSVLKWHLAYFFLSVSVVALVCIYRIPVQ